MSSRTFGGLALIPGLLVRPAAVVLAVALSLGPAAVAHTHFGHAPPTAAELEMAIAAVEDEIMRLRGTVPRASHLAVDWDPTRFPETLTDSDAGPVPLEAVERQFNVMVEAALRSATTGAESPYTNGVIATVLVLREIMHHLGFEWLVPGSPGKCPTDWWPAPARGRWLHA